MLAPTDDEGEDANPDHDVEFFLEDDLVELETGEESL